MKGRLLVSFSASVLGAALTLATPAMAFRGGVGFGGMHGGFGGGMHFSGMASRGMIMGRSAFVPGAGRFAPSPFAGRRFAGDRSNNFALRDPFSLRNRFFFRHHPRFRNFALLAGLDWPYYYPYAYDGCWQQVWTEYGGQWVDACYGYGY